MNHFNFVIPYRNRPNCLRIFQERFPAYLRTQDYIDSFNIIVIEQEEGKLFNLAKLINVGYDITKKHFNAQPEDRFFWHPVDAVPTSGGFEIPKDGAVMLCEYDRKKGLIWYYPKAHGFRSNVLEQVNGYSNEYWGWGREDDDMFVRLEAKKIPTYGTWVEFDYLMESVGRESNSDIKETDVKDFSHLETSDKLIAHMRTNRDPSVSGLNTLSYRILGQSVLDPLSNICHFRVEI